MPTKFFGVNALVEQDGALRGGNFVGKNSRSFKLRNSLHFLICAWVPIQKLNFYYKMNSIWAESNVISTGIKWHSLSKLFGFAWNRGERERERFLLRFIDLL